MIITAITFTSQGEEKLRSLMELTPDILWQQKPEGVDGKAWTMECFQKHLPMLFVGATGIAVRYISPFVEDKLCDSPVLVMDEKGQFLIPILSGHMGGANAIACRLAKASGAVPVITTATDVEKVFSVDSFARINGLRIVQREGIRKVSELALSGKSISLWIDPEIELPKEPMPEGLYLVEKAEDYADVRICLEERQETTSNCLITLIPRLYCVGMGCKRGKSFEDINSFATMILDGVLWKETVARSMEREIYAFATIDLKLKELGLQTFAQYYKAPLYTYSAEELKAQQGSFSQSAFVEQTTGVSNVCERSAMACAGAGASLVIKRTACDGMTIAVAKRRPRITSWACR